MAALDFLNHVKKRSKEEEEEVKDTSDSASSSKVVFKKPTKTNRPRAENDKSSEDQGGASYSMASCGNSKRVMPRLLLEDRPTQGVSSKGKLLWFLARKRNRKLLLKRKPKKRN